MTDAVIADPIVREVHIRATPEVVFGFFTEPDKVTRWLCEEVTLDPRPGGVCRQVHRDDGRQGRAFEMPGEFVEVVPHERIVFTWGFADPSLGVPPRSTVVEVTLTPEGDGTRVRLVHRGLPVAEVASHTAGWTSLLERLTGVVS